MNRTDENPQVELEVNFSERPTDPLAFQVRRKLCRMDIENRVGYSAGKPLLRARFHRSSERAFGQSSAVRTGRT